MGPVSDLVGRAYELGAVRSNTWELFLEMSMILRKQLRSTRKGEQLSSNLGTVSAFQPLEPNNVVQQVCTVQTVHAYLGKRKCSKREHAGACHGLIIAPCE
jgi:hypothetical protein